MGCHFFLVGLRPHRDYRIGSNFWKFYLTKTGFTLGESVSLVNVFRLFRLEWIFFGVQSADMVDRCPTSYLLAGPVCLVNIQIYRITCMLVGGMNDPSLRYCKLTLQFSFEAWGWGWPTGSVIPFCQIQHQLIKNSDVSIFQKFQGQFVVSVRKFSRQRCLICWNLQIEQNLPYFEGKLLKVITFRHSIHGVFLQSRIFL